MVERRKAKQLAGQDIDTFDLDWLQVSIYRYLHTTSVEAVLGGFSLYLSFVAFHSLTVTNT
jgi:hypothetical protein